METLAVTDRLPSRSFFDGGAFQGGIEFERHRDFAAVGQWDNNPVISELKFNGVVWFVVLSGHSGFTGSRRHMSAFIGEHYLDRRRRPRQHGLPRRADLIQPPDGLFDRGLL